MNIISVVCILKRKEIHKEESLGLSLPSRESQKPSHRRWGVGQGKVPSSKRVSSTLASSQHLSQIYPRERANVWQKSVVHSNSSISAWKKKFFFSVFQQLSDHSHFKNFYFLRLLIFIENDLLRVLTGYAQSSDRSYKFSLV